MDHFLKLKTPHPRTATAVESHALRLSPSAPAFTCIIVSKEEHWQRHVQLHVLVPLRPLQMLVSTLCH